MPVELEDLLIKEFIEVWARTHGLDAINCLEDHLLQLFGDQRYTIIRARESCGALMVIVQCAKWPTSRDFGLTPEGRLFYDKLTPH